MNNFIFFLSLLFPIVSYSMNKGIFFHGDCDISSYNEKQETEQESINQLMLQQLGTNINTLKTIAGIIYINDKTASLCLGHPDNPIVTVNNNAPDHDSACNCAIFAVSPDKTRIVFESLHPAEHTNELHTITLFDEKVYSNILDTNDYKKPYSCRNKQRKSTDSYLYKKLFSYLAIANNGTIALVNQKNNSTAQGNNDSISINITPDSSIELLEPITMNHALLYYFNSDLCSVKNMRFNNKSTQLFVNMLNKKNNTSAVIGFNMKN